MSRRVAVTGVGVVSALGLDRPAHLEALREGRNGVSALEITDVERLSVRIGAQAKAFDGAVRFDRQELSLFDRTTQMALTAAAEAVADSRLELSDEEALRAGVVMGTALNGMETVDANYRAVFQDGKNRIHPFVVPRLMTNAGTSQISMSYGLRGPSWTVSTACSSSNHAIGQAFQMVRSGVSDVMLTGGAEAPLFFGVIKAWEGLRVMSREACRPFSKNRSGMVQGEGAAVLVLEEMGRAKARGARIWGEIAGFGMSADALDIVTPSLDGAARAMRAALNDAEMTPEEVDYINAHGTATAANDRTECAAIREVLGAAAGRLSVSSTKSMHGHCIGAAGALEAAAVLMALDEGVIPPTINYEEPDPACALDVTPCTARERVVRAALSNSFAFGGLNAVLAFRSAA
ncbi:beta-ketoacyl-[acyl-carrier-protein] synthase family protein [Pikeienuella piscinae]|uniref:Nodulation protein E n=1 Tax=Pikeienuella piscinae TaxID=2748098 RepID=A0A7L5BT86_9RHOB|nr:beta-ketoacyl-[acyl-carrier-protein] synthase family protein [Pikeienuella piscinae]QIE54745.1 beta-ketoacyl-[acyl-carrier-protein] synthase family protein [Pikeienuella piscinae]